MKIKILFMVISINLLFCLGEMPKGWDMPSTYDNKDQAESIVGLWNIDLDKIVEEYRKTPEYKEAGEFAEMGIEMIKGIFSSMKFEFKKDGTYLLIGVPNPNGETEDFEGTWYDKNGFIVLESPNDANEKDLVFKLSKDRLIPQDRDAKMFYLLRAN